MNIRPAQPGDLPALLEIFAHARAFMRHGLHTTQQKSYTWKGD